MLGLLLVAVTAAVIGLGVLRVALVVPKKPVAKDRTPPRA